MEDKTFEYSMKSRENFAELDKMIGKLVSQCNKKTLVDSHILSTLKDSDLLYHVPNAFAVQHHNINGINIYAILNNQNKPIDFFISDEQVIKQKEYFGLGGEKKYVSNNIQKRPFLEYSIGGIKNGFEIDINKFAIQKHISVIAFDSLGKLGNQLIMASSYKLLYTSEMLDQFITIGAVTAKEKMAREKYLSGDLISFLPDSEIKGKEEISNILDKIKSMTMNKEEEKTPEKVSFLKTLLGKNKELNKQIDVFSKNFSK